MKNIRVVADKVGESIAGVAEIHANDTSAWHSADISDRLYENYKIRFKIYNWKYFIKFLNNFMNQLTPFFFYLIGGYLVIEGEMSIGALLAVIAAYKDLAGPWKELLAYYQLVADVEVKYQTVVENFDPQDIYPVERLTADDAVELRGDLVMNNVSFSGGAAGQEVFEASLTVPAGATCAIVGPDGSGRAEVLQLAAGLISPSSGRVEIGGHNLDALTEATLGRQIAYVGSSVHVWTGTVRQNFFYGLRHRPLRPAAKQGEALSADQARILEAQQTANPTHDTKASWEDVEAAGVPDLEALDHRALELAERIGLASDVYRMGLQSRLDPKANGELTERILAVRRIMSERLAEGQGARGLVELWDINRFNNSATVAENLLFAVPADPSVSLDRVAEDPDVSAFLAETGRADKLAAVGMQIAQTMVELFANISDDSGLLGNYSFITQDELPEFERIVRQARLEGDGAKASPADKAKLIGLTFKLIPARHRLGVLDDALKEDIVAARRAFHNRIGPDGGRFVIFDPDRYLAPMSIEDNLLFGRPRVDRRDAREHIDRMIRSLVEEMELRLPITRAGLDFHVGVAGSRLSASQRRRVALVRALLKRAAVTVLDETASGVNDEDKALRKVIRDELKGRTLLFGTSNLIVAQEFEHSVRMEHGRVVRSDAAA